MNVVLFGSHKGFSSLASFSLSDMDFSFTIMRFVGITEGRQKLGADFYIHSSWKASMMIKAEKTFRCVNIRPKCYKYGFAYLCWAFISLGFIQLMRYIWAEKRTVNEKRQNQNHKNLVKNYHYTIKLLLLLMPERFYFPTRKSISVNSIPRGTQMFNSLFSQKWFPTWIHKMRTRNLVFIHHPAEMSGVWKVE